MASHIGICGWNISIQQLFGDLIWSHTIYWCLRCFWVTVVTFFPIIEWNRARKCVPSASVMSWWKWWTNWLVENQNRKKWFWFCSNKTTQRMFLCSQKLWVGFCYSWRWIDAAQTQVFCCNEPLGLCPILLSLSCVVLCCVVLCLCRECCVVSFPPVLVLWCVMLGRTVFLCELGCDEVVNQWENLWRRVLSSPNPVGSVALRCVMYVAMCYSSLCCVVLHCAVLSRWYDSH